MVNLHLNNWVNFFKGNIFNYPFILLNVQFILTFMHFFFVYFVLFAQVILVQSFMLGMAANIFVKNVTISHWEGYSTSSMQAVKMKNKINVTVKTSWLRTNKTYSDVICWFWAIGTSSVHEFKFFKIFWWSVKSKSLYFFEFIKIFRIQSSHFIK